MNDLTGFWYLKHISQKITIFTYKNKNKNVEKLESVNRANEMYYLSNLLRHPVQGVIYIFIEIIMPLE